VIDTDDRYLIRSLGDTKTSLAPHIAGRFRASARDFEGSSRRRMRQYAHPSSPARGRVAAGIEQDTLVAFCAAPPRASPSSSFFSPCSS
jgi:hypothetical protein